MATNSSQSPSSFLFTDATPTLAWLLATTSLDARLSSRRPVQTLMLSSTSMDEEEIVGADTAGEVKVA
jgi:hypothetical protein